MITRLLSVALPTSVLLSASSLVAQCGLSTAPITFPIAAGPEALFAAAELAGGDIVFGGRGSSLLTRWDGSSLQTIANGPDLSVQHLDRASNGDLVVAGTHNSAFILGSQRVSRWDGSNWSQLSWGPINTQYALVGALATGPSNEVVATGSFLVNATFAQVQVVRWTGGVCTPLGSATGGLVYDCAVATNGDIYIAGDFTHVDGIAARNLARYDGTTWQSVGTGVSTPLRTVLALRDGGIAAFGSSAWQFDGTTIELLGTFATGDQPAEAIELDNGDLIVAGSLTSVAGIPAFNMARFDGDSWTAFGGATNPVAALAYRSSGAVFAAGTFQLTPFALQPFALETTTSCPATTIATGSGCATSGGIAALASDKLPWVGSTFSAEATGLPTNGVALAVTGFSSLNVPIANLLPQGAPGCDLLTSVDHSELVPILAGQATSSLALPNLPVLAGTTLRHQIAAFEFSIGGPLLSVTSTNALSLTLGWL